MASVDMERGAGAEDEEEEEASVCFSDADDVSCNSHFFSTADGDVSHEDVAFISEILEDEAPQSRRPSDCSVSIENAAADGGGGGEEEFDVSVTIIERDCRICHLSLASSSPSSGTAIDLGCRCKDDLAAAHKACAENWFKIKGNKTCEICNSIAINVVGPTDIEAGRLPGDPDGGAAAAAAASTTTTAQAARRWLNGHRFLNFLLTCMVIAFGVSWFFHFNIPS